MDALLQMLIDLAVAVLPYALLAIGVFLAGCFVLAWIIRRWARWRTKMTRSHFAVKSKLLALEALVEFYSPASRYMHELRENQKGKQLAWLSPYRRAVKRAIKDNRASSRGKLYNARKHVADTAAHVKIGPVPEDVFVAGESSDHYRIDLDLDGHDSSEFAKLAGKIKAQLGLHSLEIYRTRDNYSVSYIAHVTEPVDVLTTLGVNADWLDEHPAETPYSLPIAIKQDGSPWTLPTHHTIILGETGSGKGSPLHAIIRQLAPFVVNGTVQLHGADVKAVELAVYKENASLFEEVVYEPEEAGEMIAELKHKMDQRTRGLKIDRVKRLWTRRIKASVEYPLQILIIDELWDLLEDLDKASYEALNSIGRKGRAPGFLIIAATQSVEMSVMGNLRKHFVNKLCLKQDSLGFNDYMLGSEAALRGFDSTQIPPATEENDYATAGIGYVKKGQGDPEKVRFAYSREDQVFDLLDAVDRDKRKPELRAVPSGAPVFEEDEFSAMETETAANGDFTITSVGQTVDGGYGSDFD